VKRSGWEGGSERVPRVRYLFAFPDGRMDGPLTDSATFWPLLSFVLFLGPLPSSSSRNGTYNAFSFADRAVGLGLSLIEKHGPSDGSLTAAL
jgi:hypothetical protein